MGWDIPSGLPVARSVTSLTVTMCGRCELCLLRRAATTKDMASIWSLPDYRGLIRTDRWPMRLPRNWQPCCNEQQKKENGANFNVSRQSSSSHDLTVKPQKSGHICTRDAVVSQKKPANSVPTKTNGVLSLDWRRLVSTQLSGEFGKEHTSKGSSAKVALCACLVDSDKFKKL